MRFVVGKTVASRSGGWGLSMRLHVSAMSLKPDNQTSSAFKQRFDLLLNFLLPQPNLARMNSIFLANLVDRLHPSQCLQANLRLELQRVNFPLLRFLHIFSFLMPVHRLIRCPKNGIHSTIGVQDIVRAYMWYELSVAAGNDAAAANRGSAEAGARMPSAPVHGMRVTIPRQSRGL